jgi:hypothetical protein
MVFTLFDVTGAIQVPVLPSVGAVRFGERYFFAEASIPRQVSSGSSLGANQVSGAR